MHPGIQSWKNLLIYAFNAFSIPVLSKTLFAPWKRDSSAKGFGFFERMTFALFSRFLGFIIRLALIISGLLFCLGVIIAFPIFFFFPIKIDKEHLASLGSIGASLSYGNTFTLNAHGRDVMSPFSQKLYGKEKALRMIERGLSKDKDHNVLIIGDDGVGKTTLISYLGRLGQSGLSFLGIRQHRVVELQVEGLSLADFDKALHEAAAAGNVIVVIENIHAYEALYEHLMPYLQRKHLGVIVTTDFSNYDQVLKRHPEFLNKFEKVDLLPTTSEETVEILKNNLQVAGGSIDPEAVTEIVRLTDRYIGNQPQPAKSLAILEELRALHQKITVEDVRQVVSDRTNMPIGAIGTEEKKILTELEVTMRNKIVGQDEAVKDVSQALRRLRTGISDPTKPAGSFLFLGPTGVGKTYTAKILAESYFGRKNAMIAFDMSEFSLPESVTHFTDRLASVIEEAPLSLVFFDELEKANHLIHNLLLQVLDEGRLTRGSGREASFKEAIIIATSNAGAANIIANPGIDKKTLIDELIRNNIFAPEFLNRFSDVILFQPLNIAQSKQITRLLLVEFAQRLQADKQITLEITDALIDRIAAAGFDPEFGARPIKRAMEEIVENRVAEFIMSGDTSGIIKIL